jgi:hypothetical protein
VPSEFQFRPPPYADLNKKVFFFHRRKKEEDPSLPSQQMKDDSVTLAL